MPQAALRTITNRRTVLTGTAALVVTASGASGRTPDPIFAAIEAHNKSALRFNAAIKRHYKLEQELPRDQRKTLHADEVVETDDPRWIETMQALDDANLEMFDFARDLLQTDITTTAGVIAFLDHVAGSADGRRFHVPRLSR